MRVATLVFRDDGRDDPKLIFLILPSTVCNCRVPLLGLQTLNHATKQQKKTGFKIWETPKWLGTWWVTNGISKAGYQSLHPNFQLNLSLSSATRTTWSIRMMTNFMTQLSQPQGVYASYSSKASSGRRLRQFICRAHDRSTPVGRRL